MLTHWVLAVQHMRASQVAGITAGNCSGRSASICSVTFGSRQVPLPAPATPTPQAPRTSTTTTASFGNKVVWRGPAAEERTCLHTRSQRASQTARERAGASRDRNSELELVWTSHGATHPLVSPWHAAAMRQ